MTNGTPDSIPPPAAVDATEALLVRALRERDEAAFSELLDRWYGSMVRIAAGYLRSRAQAEEVVQETWLAVLSGIDRFEGRSSLKTWIFRILVNRARTVAVRESRMIPVSSLFQPDDAGELDDLPDAGQGAWLPAAEHWSDRRNPEDWILTEELRGRIEAAIEALPHRQREVITLRDIEGWSAEEVRDALEVTEANQRVLLHRARVKVRNALSDYLQDTNP